MASKVRENQVFVRNLSFEVTQEVSVWAFYDVAYIYIYEIIVNISFHILHYSYHISLSISLFSLWWSTSRTWAP